MIPAATPLSAVDYNTGWRPQFSFESVSGGEMIGRNIKRRNIFSIITFLPCQFCAWFGRVSPDEIDKVSSIAFPTMFALFNVSFFYYFISYICKFLDSLLVILCSKSSICSYF